MAQVDLNPIGGAGVGDGDLKNQHGVAVPGFAVDFANNHKFRAWSAGGD